MKYTRNQRYNAKMTRMANRQTRKLAKESRKLSREKASLGKTAVREAGSTIRSVFAQTMTPKAIGQIQARKRDNSAQALNEYLALMGGSVESGGTEGTTQTGSTTNITSGSVGGG